MALNKIQNTIISSRLENINRISLYESIVLSYNDIDENIAFEDNSTEEITRLSEDNIPKPNDIPQPIHSIPELLIGYVSNNESLLKNKWDSLSTYDVPNSNQFVEFNEITGKFDKYEKVENKTTYWEEFIEDKKENFSELKRYKQKDSGKIWNFYSYAIDNSYISKLYNEMYDSFCNVEHFAKKSKNIMRSFDQYSDELNYLKFSIESTSDDKFTLSEYDINLLDTQLNKTNDSTYTYISIIPKTKKLKNVDYYIEATNGVHVDYDGAIYFLDNAVSYLTVYSSADPTNCTKVAVKSTGEQPNIKFKRINLLKSGNDTINLSDNVKYKTNTIVSLSGVNGNTVISAFVLPANKNVSYPLTPKVKRKGINSFDIIMIGKGSYVLKYTILTPSFELVNYITSIIIDDAIDSCPYSTEYITASKTTLKSNKGSITVKINSDKASKYVIPASITAQFNDYSIKGRQSNSYPLIKNIKTKYKYEFDKISNSEIEIAEINFEADSDISDRNIPFRIYWINVDGLINYVDIGHKDATNVSNFSAACLLDNYLNYGETLNQELFSLQKIKTISGNIKLSLSLTDKLWNNNEINPLIAKQVKPNPQIVSLQNQTLVKFNSNQVKLIDKLSKKAVLNKQNPSLIIENNILAKNGFAKFEPSKSLVSSNIQTFSGEIKSTAKLSTINKFYENKLINNPNIYNSPVLGFSQIIKDEDSLVLWNVIPNIYTDNPTIIYELEQLRGTAVKGFKYNSNEKNFNISLNKNPNFDTEMESASLAIEISTKDKIYISFKFNRLCILRNGERCIVYNIDKDSLTINGIIDGKKIQQKYINGCNWDIKTGKITVDNEYSFNVVYSSLNSRKRISLSFSIDELYQINDDIIIEDFKNFNKSNASSSTSTKTPINVVNKIDVTENRIDGSQLINKLLKNKYQCSHVWIKNDTTLENVKIINNYTKQSNKVKLGDNNKLSIVDPVNTNNTSGYIFGTFCTINNKCAFKVLHANEYSNKYGISNLSAPKEIKEQIVNDDSLRSILSKETHILNIIPDNEYLIGLRYHSTEIDNCDLYTHIDTKKYLIKILVKNKWITIEEKSVDEAFTFNFNKYYKKYGHILALSILDEYGKLVRTYILNTSFIPYTKSNILLERVHAIPLYYFNDALSSYKENGDYDNLLPSFLFYKSKLQNSISAKTSIDSYYSKVAGISAIFNNSNFKNINPRLSLVENNVPALNYGNLSNNGYLEYKSEKLFNYLSINTNNSNKYPYSMDYIGYYMYYLNMIYLGNLDWKLNTDFDSEDSIFYIVMLDKLTNMHKTFKEFKSKLNNKKINNIDLLNKGYKIEANYVDYFKKYYDNIIKFWKDRIKAYELMEYVLSANDESLSITEQIDKYVDVLGSNEIKRKKIYYILTNTNSQGNWTISSITDRLYDNVSWYYIWKNVFQIMFEGEFDFKLINDAILRDIYNYGFYRTIYAYEQENGKAKYYKLSLNSENKATIVQGDDENNYEYVYDKENNIIGISTNLEITKNNYWKSIINNNYLEDLYVVVDESNGHGILKEKDIYRTFSYMNELFNNNLTSTRKLEIINEYVKQYNNVNSSDVNQLIRNIENIQENEANILINNFINSSYPSLTNTEIKNIINGTLSDDELLKSHTNYTESSLPKLHKDIFVLTTNISQKNNEIKTNKIYEFVEAKKIHNENNFTINIKGQFKPTNKNEKLFKKEIIGDKIIYSRLLGKTNTQHIVYGGNDIDSYWITSDKKHLIKMTSRSLITGIRLQKLLCELFISELNKTMNMVDVIQKYFDIDNSLNTLKTDWAKKFVNDENFNLYIKNPIQDFNLLGFQFNKNCVYPQETKIDGNISYSYIYYSFNEHKYKESVGISPFSFNLPITKNNNANYVHNERIYDDNLEIILNTPINTGVKRPGIVQTQLLPKFNIKAKSSKQLSTTNQMIYINTENNVKISLDKENKYVLVKVPKSMGIESFGIYYKNINDNQPACWSTDVCKENGLITFSDYEKISKYSDIDGNGYKNNQVVVNNLLSGNLENAPAIQLCYSFDGNNSYDIEKKQFIPQLDVTEYTHYTEILQFNDITHEVDSSKIVTDEKDIYVDTKTECYLNKNIYPCTILSIKNLTYITDNIRDNNSKYQLKYANGCRYYVKYCNEISKEEKYSYFNLIDFEDITTYQQFINIVDISNDYVNLTSDIKIDTKTNKSNNSILDTPTNEIINRNKTINLIKTSTDKKISEPDFANISEQSITENSNSGLSLLYDTVIETVNIRIYQRLRGGGIVKAVRYYDIKSNGYINTVFSNTYLVITTVKNSEVHILLSGSVKDHIILANNITLQTAEKLKEEEQKYLDSIKLAEFVTNISEIIKTEAENRNLIKIDNKSINVFINEIKINPDLKTLKFTSTLDDIIKLYAKDKESVKLYYQNNIKTIKSGEIKETNTLKHSKYFLGSVSQWQIVQDNVLEINKYLKDINGDQFYDGSVDDNKLSTRLFWTSSEISKDEAWMMFFEEYCPAINNKKHSAFIRPFVKISSIRPPKPSNDVDEE